MFSAEGLTLTAAEETADQLDTTVACRIRPPAQIAKGFGLSVTTGQRWIAIAERRDSGAGPAAVEVRELGRCNRLLEQENGILRRAAAYLAIHINPK